MTGYREEDVVKGMTDEEKIRYAIAKLRLFAKEFVAPGEKLNPDYERVCKENGVLLTYPPSKLLETITPKVKTIEQVEGITFEGYIVDVHNNIYIKKASDAILELARRLEQTYLYNVVGSIAAVPRDFLDAEFLFGIAEANLYDLLYMRLLPASIRVKLRDEPRKQVLNISDNGLIPLMICKDSELTEDELNTNIEIFASSLQQTEEDKNI